MKARSLILLLAVALFLTICTAVAPPWAPLVYATLTADAAALAYGIGLKFHLIRAGRAFEKERSEFGAGLVVCLVKFSEHLWNDHSIEVWEGGRWIEDGKVGPLPEKIKRMWDISIEIRGSAEAALSSSIEMWMSGASDHFYDLDRKRAPEPLIDLADITLNMGHGFSDRVWTLNDVKLMIKLWEKAAVALDKQLKTKPDWGSY